MVQPQGGEYNPACEWLVRITKLVRTEGLLLLRAPELGIDNPPTPADNITERLFEVNRGTL